MKTLLGWSFSKPEFHAATEDGDCMAGPTAAYYRVWATREVDGAVSIGCGDSAEAALELAVENAKRKDGAFEEAAKLLCAEMGYLPDTWPEHVQKIREHAALHTIMHKVGLFYPQ